MVDACNEVAHPFHLHSVVLEHVTEQLIEDVAHELLIGELARRRASLDALPAGRLQPKYD